jgi:hypothetical protein
LAALRKVAFLHWAGDFMSDTRNDWINQRAYSLWEAEGRPEGRGGSHWAQAAGEFERLEQTRASADGSELVAKLRAAGHRMLGSAHDESLLGEPRINEMPPRKFRRAG